MCVKVHANRKTGLKQQSLILIGAYVQPSTSKAALDYIKFFVENIQKSQPDDLIVLAEDFNIDPSVFETWSETMNLYRCQPSSPGLFTRADAHSSSTIDHIALNRNPGVWESISTDGLSDHLLLLSKLLGPFPVNP